MNKFFFLLLVVDLNCLAQNLPYKDKGFAISYNYSQRRIPGYSNKLEPIFFPTADFKINRNFKNKLSLKSGSSIFVTGHRSEIYVSQYYYSTSSELEKVHTIYGYLRFPICLSYNIKRLYIDWGGAPRIRLFELLTIYGKGDSNTSKLTYTLEAHIGYYIPIKQRRLFIETAIYFSEIGKDIFLAREPYHMTLMNSYTQNIQLSIGIMLNKASD